MKKLFCYILIIAVMFTALIPATSTETYAATKYVKVKKATFEKYKKAYKVTVPKQKKTIASLNNTISEKKSTISWLWDTLEDYGYEYSYDSHEWQAVQDTSQKTIIEEQTGLTVDYIKPIEKYNRWAAYYVEADGDIYCVTVVREKVEVCQILN